MANSTAAAKRDPWNKTSPETIQKLVEAYRAGETPTVRTAAKFAGVSAPTAHKYLRRENAIVRSRNQISRAQFELILMADRELRISKVDGAVYAHVSYPTYVRVLRELETSAKHVAEARRLMRTKPRD